MSDLAPLDRFLSAHCFADSEYGNVEFGILMYDTNVKMMIVGVVLFDVDSLQVYFCCFFFR